MVLIRQNKGAKIILRAKSPTFTTAKFKGFTVFQATLNVLASICELQWASKIIMKWFQSSFHALKYFSHVSTKAELILK